MIVMFVDVIQTEARTILEARGNSVYQSMQTPSSIRENARRRLAPARIAVMNLSGDGTGLAAADMVRTLSI